MEKVRFGIIGLGNMGSGHIRNFNAGKIPNGEITAVCDIDPEALERGAKLVNHEVKTFLKAEDLMASGEVDAILVATPHYLHPVYAIKGLNAGLNVLIEKPAGVYTKAVREMNEVASKSDKVFGVMFNQRTNPLYKKIKELIDSGELGEIRRVVWIITNWFRTQNYYDSGSWRATWGGEGGGVLMNQSPHQLDMLQWLCGMPSKVSGHCAYGKYHNIEVEDDVTAYFEFPNGATGVFITTTGEAPGTNRLEIAGTRGKIVVEAANAPELGIQDSCINFYRTCKDVQERIENTPNSFEVPETWKVEIHPHGENPQHVGICNNFCDAVLKGEKLLAPGQEGINGVTIANAIYMSDWIGKTVELPLDEDRFYDLLQEKIKTSTFKKKKVTGSAPTDLSGTY